MRTDHHRLRPSIGGALTLLLVGFAVLALMVALPSFARASPPTPFEAEVMAPTVMVVDTDCRCSGGSGTVIGASAHFWLVLTANHVTAGMGPFVAVSADGGTTYVDGLVVAADPGRDLAAVFVLRTDLEEMAVAELAPPGPQPPEGTEVWAAGAGALYPPWATVGIAGPTMVHDIIPDGPTIWAISSAPTIHGHSGGGVYLLSADGRYQLYGVVQAGPSDVVTLQAPLAAIWGFLIGERLDRFVGQPAA